MLPTVKVGDQFRHRTLTPGEAIGEQRPNLFTVAGVHPETGELLVHQADAPPEETVTRWDPATFHETFEAIPPPTADQLPTL